MHFPLARPRDVAPCAQGGLIEDSRRTLKNLDAAIVASKQPGYFKYHKPNEKIQRIRERDEPGSLSKRISDLQREIDSVRYRPPRFPTRAPVPTRAPPS